MSRGHGKIRSVAQPKKGNDRDRKLRLPGQLADDIATLAEIHHRSGNDEIIVALEAHRERHAAELSNHVRKKKG